MVFSKIFGKKCARCGATRTKEEFEGLPTCDDCETVIHAEREVTEQCPKCKTTMTKEIVLNVIVDKCGTCHGAWLDGGELEVLREALESDGGGGDFATGLVLGMAMG